MDALQHHHSAADESSSEECVFQDGISRVHRKPFGAELQHAGGVQFRLWAPAAQSVRLELQGGAELLPLNERRRRLARINDITGRGGDALSVRPAR